MAVLNYTAREFRSQQARVLDLADRGDKVIIRRGRKRAYTLVPVEDDDLEMTPELRARIEEARKEYRAGKYYEMKPDENLDSFLDRLEAEGVV